MGEVDDQGRFWISESGKKWWSIDVKPGSTNFGKILTTGTSAANLLSGVADWAYVPGGGNYLYSVQLSVVESGLLRTNLVRWSLDTNTWERFRSYNNLLLALNVVWGATFGTADGNLFAQEDLLGGTYKFAITTSETSPTTLPPGDILNLAGGDGARCIGA
ncbi:hypothetical protein NM208_g16617 [Fusarium decemcellulare]|uniref:Uncharacterized protein n=1 Tax=Fusarium decemcellulare TaxID=57161 RepID=A0ACC1RD28_9HYPO|nr:hypothetical protein NM208_g16617 [Fusarium decemcellulare]